MGVERKKRERESESDILQTISSMNGTENYMRPSLRPLHPHIASTQCIHTLHRPRLRLLYLPLSIGTRDTRRDTAASIFNCFPPSLFLLPIDTGLPSLVPLFVIFPMTRRKAGEWTGDVESGRRRSKSQQVSSELFPQGGIFM